MAEKINTGKYRIRREIVGQARTKQTLKEFDNQNDCIRAYSNINKADRYSYYIEEETFYRGTLKDANNNPIDSTPSWTRM